MRTRAGTTIVTYCLLGLAGGVTFIMPSTLLPQSSRADSAPNMFRLYGTARDFHAGHPDFEIRPSTGFGHDTGLVAERLGLGYQPVYTGQGKRVIVPALDSLGRNIAPHLANQGFVSLPEDTPSFNLAVDHALTVRRGSIIDAYDSRDGAYGSTEQREASIAVNARSASAIILSGESQIRGNIHAGVTADVAVVLDQDETSLHEGEIECLEQPVRMPLPETPGVINSELGRMTIGSTELHVSSDIRFEDLVLDAARIIVDADVAILIDGTCSITGGSEVIVTDDATLSIYANGAVTIEDSILNADTANPWKVSIHALGMDLEDRILLDDSQVAARVMAPSTGLELRNQAELFGTFAGESLVLDNARLHEDLETHDRGYLHVAKSSGDTPASLLDHPQDGGVTSADTFNEWFSDRLGINLSEVVPLTFFRQPNGTFLFEDLADQRYGELGGFFPIDRSLFGAEDSVDGHNYHFTYEMAAYFTYDAGSSQYVRLTTDSDAWLFIDGRLAIDLGGMHSMLEQRIDLDRLGLRRGETYRLDLLLASRNAPTSRLRIETNIPMAPDTPVTASAAYD